MGDYSRCECGLKACHCDEHQVTDGYSVILLIQQRDGYPDTIVTTDLCGTCNGCLATCDYAEEEIITTLKRSIDFWEKQHGEETPGNAAGLSDQVGEGTKAVQMYDEPGGV